MYGTGNGITDNCYSSACAHSVTECTDCDILFFILTEVSAMILFIRLYPRAYPLSRPSMTGESRSSVKGVHYNSSLQCAGRISLRITTRRKRYAE